MPVHPTHVTRHSDASTFDEICVLCGNTDTAGTGQLHMPCPTAGGDRRAALLKKLDACFCTDQHSPPGTPECANCLAIREELKRWDAAASMPNPVRELFGTVARRWRVELPAGKAHPINPRATHFYGCYFPQTDLNIGEGGARGTGRPRDVEWLDRPAEAFEQPASEVQYRVVYGLKGVSEEEARKTGHEHLRPRYEPMTLPGDGVSPDAIRHAAWLALRKFYQTETPEAAFQIYRVERVATWVTKIA